ncbi:unnamed protein product [Parnassius mnemosyne]|uniref:Mpv17-like protein 2 n=1 Tax=Parnassius mnemosyne TaxID=213953 RepID=A0AAV1M9B1_9NEOP
MRAFFRRGVYILFKKNLLLTNCISSGVFLGLGDLVQQEIEYQSKLLKERYDWTRTGRMFLIGTLLGPIHHYYYIYLDKVLPGIDVKTITKKIALDQVIASPVFIVLFFYGMGILENKTREQNVQDVKRKFLPTFVGDCLFWPPVQYFNFYYLPNQYRVFYGNVATMVINVFYSYIQHQY